MIVGSFKMRSESDKFDGERVGLLNVINTRVLTRLCAATPGDHDKKTLAD